MQVSDILTRIQRTFGDESGVQIQTADVIRWVNDAQREVAMQHPGLLQEVGYVTSVAGTQEYALPADLLTLTSVYYRASTDASLSYYAMRYLNIAQMNEFVDGYSGSAYNSATPLVYSRGNTEGDITIFPTPDVGYTNAIKLVYDRYPTDVTTVNSNLDVPGYYDNYIREYCMMRAYEMDEDWASADRKATYVQGVMDFNNGRESWFGHETYPTITTHWEDYI